MKIDWKEFFSHRQGIWKMVANLPYNIATPLLVTLLENAPDIQSICVMVQLEVGERFAASPKSKAYGIPSVKAQYWAETKVLGKVSPNVFLPVPKVDPPNHIQPYRSEERRVGKECRSRWSPYH